MRRCHKMGWAMVYFEVLRNGQKLCTAGVGECGVMTAIVTWVGHHPDKLVQWAAEGAVDNDPMDLFLNVGGLGGEEQATQEYLKWVEHLDLSLIHI